MTFSSTSIGEHRLCFFAAELVPAKPDEGPERKLEEVRTLGSLERQKRELSLRAANLVKMLNMKIDEGGPDTEKYKKLRDRLEAVLRRARFDLSELNPQIPRSMAESDDLSDRVGQGYTRVLRELQAQLSKVETEGDLPRFRLQTPEEQHRDDEARAREEEQREEAERARTRTRKRFSNGRVWYQRGRVDDDGEVRWERHFTPGPSIAQARAEHQQEWAERTAAKVRSQFDRLSPSMQEHYRTRAIVEEKDPYMLFAERAGGLSEDERETFLRSAERGDLGTLRALVSNTQRYDVSSDASERSARAMGHLADYALMRRNVRRGRSPVVAPRRPVRFSWWDERERAARDRKYGR